MENVYTYRLIGIKADGSDDVMYINASCETVAEIIIESFHDGGYVLESEGDEPDIDLYDTSFPGEFAHQITNPD